MELTTWVEKWKETIAKLKTTNPNSSLLAGAEVVIEDFEKRIINTEVQAS